MRPQVLFALLFLTMPISARPESSIDLRREFASPPASARPWVYWFWLNGNITREGITADLEAMKRVGIGGVLIMEVDQGVPVGPVDFMSERWRALFRHVVNESRRLGLEVNMNDDAGWNGSGGPWITPELAMQKLAWSETTVEGGKTRAVNLPQPQTNRGFYRDIAALAFPAPGAYRIPNAASKAGFQRAYITQERGGAFPKAPSASVIRRDSILDITSKMRPDGSLDWEAPEGNWTILRIGHTCTGAENAPAPISGRGLECDKLSRAGSQAAFDGMMRKLVADNRPSIGRSLVATHVDSWENGMQNWTARMREEFRTRRGYDLLTYLPTTAGYVVGSREISERFLWDFRQTINELCVDYYAGNLRDLAHKNGLRFSIEAYDGPCDDTTYAGRADEPMCEFWIGGGAFHTCKEMASAAHTYGKRILGAEAFTADNNERWLQHPGSIKSLGDRAFCEGVNRFVFHRYAMQPWVTPARKPGMTMGPWGLHYERTNTWWEEAGPWHAYLARCQHLLRQGAFVADICYLLPEASPHGYDAHGRAGYDFDNCTPEVVLSRMSVKNGRIALPDGVSYRLLVLPDVDTMTPALLRKVRQLVAEGATVIGNRPIKSPSLGGYPACDDEVQRLAADLWANCDGKAVKSRRFGKGRVLCGVTPEQALKQAGVGPDFEAAPHIRWIHRKAGDTDIYFVASSAPLPTEAICTFRVAGKRPELWNAETGRTSAAPAWTEFRGSISLPLRFEPSESMFVLFRPSKGPADPAVAVTRNGVDIWRSIVDRTGIKIVKAHWGPPGDLARTKDVTAQVQRMVNDGATTFLVANLASDGDPALNVLKTLRITYRVGGRAIEAAATDAETIAFNLPASPIAPIALTSAEQGRIAANVSAAGDYAVRFSSGGTKKLRVSALPQIAIPGPWDLRFPTGSESPSHLRLVRLTSWSDLPESKFFSGTAVYHKTIQIPAGMLKGNRRIELDLGKVQVMARVLINCRDLGILWHSPYRLDITNAARPGANRLQIRVTNLWVNRLIGDEDKAEDSARNADGTLKEWPAFVGVAKPSPAGRSTFTTWRLWKKGEKPIDSGLIGPVSLRSIQRIILTRSPHPTAVND